MFTFVLRVPCQLTDTPIASVQTGEQIDAQRGVFVVCRELLLDLPGIASVSARAIVGECFWASELVVRAWSRDDVAVRSDLTGKAFDGAGYCVVSAGITRVINDRSRAPVEGMAVTIVLFIFY
jgi:hypothetical protein